MTPRRSGRKKTGPLPDPMAWGREQSVMTRHLARSAATDSGPISDFFANLRTGHLVNLLPVPPVAVWLRYYRCRRLWENELSDLFFPRGTVESSDEPRLSEIFRQAQGAFRKIEDGVKEFLHLPDHERETLLNNLRGFWRDLSQWDDDVFAAALSGGKGEDPKAAREFVQAPAFVFMLRVVVPCLILYKDHPGRLLTKARHGNVRALEQLLTIDKSVVFEPRIREYAHRLAQHNPRQYRHQIVKPLNKPSPLVKRTKIMETLSGLVSLIASLSPGGGVNGPQLLALFDSVHQAKTGEPADPELPEKVWAFPKAVQRQRHEWERKLGIRTIGQK